VVDYVVANIKSDIKGVFAGSVPYLKLAGIVLGGWQMARAALISQQKLNAGDGDASFYKAKIATTRFFADHFLTQSSGIRTSIVEGSGAGAGAGYRTVLSAMRIAIVSDIHGNLPALEAVASDFAQRGVDWSSILAIACPGRCCRWKPRVS
jgi:hypothetical protein